MFESIHTDETAARARAAAVPPLIAGGIALLYLTLYPLLPRVPALLFWSVDAILFIGTVWGAVAITRGLHRGASLRSVAAAVGVEVVCAWLFVSFTFPWL